MVDLSKVPLIPVYPDSLFPAHTFPPEINSEIKKFFAKDESLPSVTDETLAALATKLGNQRQIEAVCSRALSNNAIPHNDGETGKELIAIKGATETLLSLLKTANPRTQELLAGSYTFHRAAPKGIEGRRYPEIEDVLFVLECFRNCILEDGGMRNLMVTGKGRRKGGADETAYMLLDDMQAVLERNGANPALVIPHINNLNVSCPDDEKTCAETPKNLGPGREGINLIALSGEKILSLVQELQIGGVETRAIKDWLAMRRKNPV